MEGKRVFAFEKFCSLLLYREAGGLLTFKNAVEQMITIEINGRLMLSQSSIERVLFTESLNRNKTSP